MIISVIMSNLFKMGNVINPSEIFSSFCKNSACVVERGSIHISEAVIAFNTPIKFVNLLGITSCIISPGCIKCFKSVFVINYFFV